MKTRMRIACALAGAGLCLFAAEVAAWRSDGNGLWPDGRVRLRLHVGGSPTYSDGFKPNTTVEESVAIWNANMDRLELTTEGNANSSGSWGNGVNNIYFSRKVLDQPFDEFTLAVTLIDGSGSERRETDIVINSEVNWDAYRGPVDFQRPDLRRVVLHEIGHVLGLSHPDEHGEFVDALMNSALNDLDTLAYDDQEGAAALYGRGTANPAGRPLLDSLTPWDLSVTEGHDASFFVSVLSGTQPLSFQWFKDGVAIPGATDDFYQLSQITRADAGVYTVTATNAVGTATSRKAVLSVEEVPAPSILDQPADVEATEGDAVHFAVTPDNWDSIQFQWFKDDAPIPGATFSSLTINAVTPADAGSYHVVATTPGGSAQSLKANLEVAPAPLPEAVRLNNITIVPGEWFSLTVPGVPNEANTYQWYHGGKPIPGATGPQFERFASADSDAGEYFVVVSNSSGSRTSTTAFVDLAPGDAVVADAWLDVQRRGHLVYFLFAEPARIERFNISTESFLPSIPLPGTPTAMHAGDSALFVAFGHTVSRFELDGTNEQPVFAAPSTVRFLWAGDDRLISVQHSGPRSLDATVTSFDLGAAATIDTAATPEIFNSGFSVTPSGDRLFARSQHDSPSDIWGLEINADGTFGDLYKSPVHGGHASATKTFIHPDGELVIDSAGAVRETSTLEHIGSFDSRIDHAEFHADGRTVLVRGSQVSIYAGNLAWLGSITLQSRGGAVVVDGDDAIVFHWPVGTTIGNERVALSDAAPRSPSPAVDPGPLAYEPDAVWLGPDGIVHLYSRVHQNIFRWSPTEGRYLKSIGLLDAPNHIAHDLEANRLYLGHASGTIRRLDPGADSIEVSFARSPAGIRNLAIAGGYLFLAGSAGSWDEFFTFAGTGRLVGWRDTTQFSEHSAWNPNNRRIYHFRDRATPDDLIRTDIHHDGSIGDTVDSPFHGEIPLRPPVVSTPSGDRALIGSGILFDAETLQQTGSLDNGFDAATWIGGTLFTARKLSGAVEVQRWNEATYSLERSVPVQGRLQGLFAVGANRLAVVTSREGRVHFTLLDANLNYKLRYDESNVAPKSRMRSISTRAEIGTNESVVIAGFSVSGTGTKRILIRAVGPTLEKLGVTDAMGDPALTVNVLGGTVVAGNDDWSDEGAAELSDAFKQVSAFGLDPESADAAVIVEVPPGSYTAVVSGSNGSSGVVLVELYDMDEPDSTARLSGISARAFVGTGSRILIPGVSVTGSDPSHLLIRAVGPGLGGFGVGGVLGNPRIVVTTLQGDVIADNDDWGHGNAPETVSFAKQLGAFSLESDSADAALVYSLSAGSYTFQISGVASGTGVALMELYEIK